MSRKKLSIAVLNLMPTKTETARQLRQLLCQQPATEVELLLLYPESHYANSVVPIELQQNYYPFAKVKEQPIDGFIVTGAPIEKLAFEEVDYWQELSEILDYLREQQIPSLSICWGAQAALYHYYQIDKQLLPAKKVGVFEHQVKVSDHPLVRGEKPQFRAPHSRYTTVDEIAVATHPELINVADSPEAGLYLLASANGLETYVFGHAEYETETLKGEYQRDLAKDRLAPLPCYYFPADDPSQVVINTWAAHGQGLFNNWLAAISQSSILSSQLKLSD